MSNFYSSESSLEIVHSSLQNRKSIKCLRGIAIFFGVLNLLVGLCLFIGALCVLIISDVSFNGAIFILTVVVVSIGGFLIFLSILGIIGACFINRNLLICYATLLILTMAARAAFAIFLIMKPAVMMPLAAEGYQHYISIVNAGADSIMHLFDDFHEQYECCGFESPNEFDNSESICGDTIVLGCKDKMEELLKEFVPVAEYLSLGAMVLPITFTICIIVLIGKL